MQGFRKRFMDEEFITYMISKVDMDDIKIKNILEDSNVMIDGIIKTVKNQKAVECYLHRLEL